MTLTADFNPNISVPFSRMRYLLQESGGGLQAGVVGATDLKVVQRGAGANMSVDVGTGGGWVAITTGTRNGLAHCFNDATANVVVTASNATNPRIDQIYLRYNDSSIPTGSGDVPTLAVATGTATVGATLDNRTGAVALPADSLRLADVLVPANSTSVVTANIRDRRPWARGAYNRIIRTSGTYTTTVATVGLIDGTNVQPRIECSGGPLRLKAEGAMLHSASSAFGFLGFWLDGAAIDGLVPSTNLYQISLPSNGASYRFTVEQEIIPSAGSHLLGPVFSNGPVAGTLTVSSGAAAPLFFTIEEIVRQNTSNT